jgi:hypothetical protein
MIIVVATPAGKWSQLFVVSFVAKSNTHGRKHNYLGKNTAAKKRSAAGMCVFLGRLRIVSSQL